MKKYSVLLAAFVCIVLACSKKNMPAPSDGKDSHDTSKPDLTPSIIDFSPNSARIGETITIKGRNFGQDTSKVSVQFGNATATAAKKVSDIEISVVVPADASSGQLSLKIANHTAIKSKEQFLLISEELKQPTVSGFSPSSGNIGQEITINGTNFGTDASRVNIILANGTIVSPKSVTPIQIIFVMPPNSISGKISIQILGFPSLITATSFTVIPTNEKVTKTIGVSWVNISLDENNNLNFAELYGGGNRLILKKGKGNTIQSAIVADALSLNDTYPVGKMHYYGDLIDNGVPIVNVNDSQHTNFTITGFDKTKTGYDELRVVMQKFVFPTGNVKSGYSYLNYYFLEANLGIREKSAFNSSFIKSLFTGEIEVLAVEIAKPKSDNRYIIRDETIQRINTWYNVASNRVTDLDIQSPWWRGFFLKPTDSKYLSVGSSLKAEWVNADKAKLTKVSERYPYYELTFDNIKKGGRLGQVVYPSDVTNKVYLRITGFNPDVTGYNELRLFLTDYGQTNDGTVRFDLSNKPDVDPTTDFIKEAFKVMDEMKCYYLAPKFP